MRLMSGYARLGFVFIQAFDCRKDYLSCTALRRIMNGPVWEEQSPEGLEQEQHCTQRWKK